MDKKHLESIYSDEEPLPEGSKSVAISQLVPLAMKLETEAGRRKVDEPLSNSLEFNIKRSQSLIVKYLAKPTYEEAIVKGKMKEA